MKGYWQCRIMWRLNVKHGLFVFMRTIFHRAGYFLLLLVSSLSFSAEQVDIYTVEVPIKSQSKYFRNLAMRQGLSEVLVRASGSDDVLSNEYIRSNLPKASAFVQQFAFQKPTNRSSELPWVLRLNFDEIVIQKLLSDADLPVWSSTRPVVLLWIAEKNNQGRQIVKANTNTAKLFLKEAKRRAIPLQVPVMDNEDSRIVDFTDIWGRFSSPIERASKRYQSNVIVFGRIYPEGNKWLSDWQMILEGERSGWRSKSDTQELASKKLLAQIGRRLCAKYCVMSSQISSNELLLRISDLDTVVAAASVEKYLLSLLPVRDINLLELEGNQALFKLRLVSREQAVLEAIALDSALSPLPSSDMISASAIGSSPEQLVQRVYNYRWVP